MRATELYHIFDFRTSAPKATMIRALTDGLSRNMPTSQTAAPIVLDAPPEVARRFTIVDGLADSPLAGLAGMMPASQTAMFKRARCDGAVWTMDGERRVRGGQRLRLTMCLFPYRGGYQLDIYGIDMKERGGGLSSMLGRAMAEAVVGDADVWTRKTILDVVRRVRADTGAVVSYVEGEPPFEGTPWDEGGGLLPTNAERTGRQGDTSGDARASGAQPGS